MRHYLALLVLCGGLLAEEAANVTVTTFVLNSGRTIEASEHYSVGGAYGTTVTAQLLNGESARFAAEDVKSKSSRMVKLASLPAAVQEVIVAREQEKIRAQATKEKVQKQDAANAAAHAEWRRSLEAEYQKRKADAVKENERRQAQADAYNLQLMRENAERVRIAQEQEAARRREEYEREALREDIREGVRRAIEDERRERYRR